MLKTHTFSFHVCNSQNLIQEIIQTKPEKSTLHSYLWNWDMHNQPSKVYSFPETLMSLE